MISISKRLARCERWKRIGLLDARLLALDDGRRHDRLVLDGALRLVAVTVAITEQGTLGMLMTGQFGPGVIDLLRQFVAIALGFLFGQFRLADEFFVICEQRIERLLRTWILFEIVSVW